MERTTVYLPADLKSALKRAARAHALSQWELIREAIGLVTASIDPPAPRLPLFESGDPGLAERVAERSRGFEDP